MSARSTPVRGKGGKPVKMPKQGTGLRLLKTYVKGFDKALGGGIPSGHLVLVSGTPGAMKSSLAYGFLYNNYKDEGLRGAYLSLEQGEASLRFHMRRLGFGCEADSKDRFPIISDLGHVRKLAASGKRKPWLDALRKYIQTMADDERLDIIVIDSLPVFEILADLSSKREDLFHFFGFLRELDATVLIINEAADIPNVMRDEEFLSDGIIFLTMERVGESDVQRRIRCVKMRGMDHAMGYFTLEFKGGEFRVSRAI